MLYSVIVPVRDEASILFETVPTVLAAASDAAEIIYVCNDCSDDSAAIILSLAGSRVQVVEISTSGKTKAFNAGDRLASCFPRFYVDADTRLETETFSRLGQILISGEADLVVPRLDYDLSTATCLSRAMAEVWLSLPYAQQLAFQSVIGVSEAGRGRWIDFPDILGDDIFVAAMISPDRRKIDKSVTAVTQLPATFFGWVSMRTRWRRGEWALVRMGLPLPQPTGQRKALLRCLLRPRNAIGAGGFILARLLAGLICSLPSKRNPSWSPDRARARK